MTYKNPQKFDLKIRLYNQEKSFGKGVYELMKKAQSFGSLSGAYKDMKMSNSKAWKILKRAEEDLDMPLVERISGGKDGGGSKLTQEGEDVEWNPTTQKSALRANVTGIPTKDQ